MHSSPVVQVINDIGQVKQAPFVFVLLMAASLSGNDFKKNLATLGHFIIWTAQKLGYQFTDPKKYTKPVIGQLCPIFQHALRAPMDTHRCMKPVTSGTKMPGVSRWVWLFMARTSFVPQPNRKKTVFWSWVVGGLAEFTGVG